MHYLGYPLYEYRTGENCIVWLAWQSDHILGHICAEVQQILLRMQTARCVWPQNNSYLNWMKIIVVIRNIFTFINLDVTVNITTLLVKTMKEASVWCDVYMKLCPGTAGEKPVHFLWVKLKINTVCAVSLSRMWPHSFSSVNAMCPGPHWRAAYSTDVLYFPAD